METRKPPSVDSELFRKMGVSFVKIENEDGTVRYKPKYAYKIKAEEAKKELLERHQPEQTPVPEMRRTDQLSPFHIPAGLLD